MIPTCYGNMLGMGTWEVPCPAFFQSQVHPVTTKIHDRYNFSEFKPMETSALASLERPAGNMKVFAAFVIVHVLPVLCQESCAAVQGCAYFQCLQDGASCGGTLSNPASEAAFFCNKIFDAARQFDVQVQMVH